MKNLFKARWKNMLCYVIIASITTAVDIYAGYTLSYFYDILTSDSITKAIYLGIYMLVIRGISALLGYLILNYRATFVRILNNDIRKHILDRLSEMKYFEYVEKGPGEYVSWLTNDINQIEKNTIVPALQVVEAVFSGVFATIVLCQFHPYILLISVVSGILLSVIPRFFQRTISRIAEQQSKAGERLLQRINNGIAGLEVFFTTNRRNRITEFMMKPCAEFEEEKEKFNKKSALMSTCSLFFFRFFELAVMIFTALLAFKGIVSVGSVFSIGNLGNRFLNAVNDVLTNLVIIKSSKPLFEKIWETHDMEPAKAKKECPPVQHSITIHNFSVSYGGCKVIDSSDFTFFTGKKYAIIGKSGTGKTTLVKSIMGMVKEYQGRICFDGVDIKEYTQDSVCTQFAYVSQEPYVFNQSVRFNLTLGDDYTAEELEEVLRKVDLYDTVCSRKDGIETILNDSGKNMSGGQRQRLTLARALLLHKKIFIIDEGTSALDVQTTEKIEKVFLDNPDIMVIYITHHLTDQNKFDAINHLL